MNAQPSLFGAHREKYSIEGAAGAVFDESGRYRYRLWRTWDASAPRCLFIMLNPSTADAVVLDPTVRKCVKFAKAWGYGTLEVCNIFALRSTDPRALYDADDPIGPDNDDAIAFAARRAGQIVVAWGVHGALHDRGKRVLVDLSFIRPVVRALRVTKDGHPGHPLYVRDDVLPEAYP